MVYITGLYHNDTMSCEGVFGMCRRAVARVYQPFCSDCWKRAVSRGKFKSRNDKSYRYNGRRWVMDIDVDITGVSSPLDKV